MFCTNCGGFIPDDFNFCEHCGTPTDAQHAALCATAADPEQGWQQDSYRSDYQQDSYQPSYQQPDSYQQGYQQADPYQRAPYQPGYQQAPYQPSYQPAAPYQPGYGQPKKSYRAGVIVAAVVGIVAVIVAVLFATGIVKVNVNMNGGIDDPGFTVSDYCGEWVFAEMTMDGQTIPLGDMLVGPYDADEIVDLYIYYDGTFDMSVFDESITDYSDTTWRETSSGIALEMDGETIDVVYDASTDRLTLHMDGNTIVLERFDGSFDIGSDTVSL